MIQMQYKLNTEFKLERERQDAVTRSYLEQRKKVLERNRSDHTDETKQVKKDVRALLHIPPWILHMAALLDMSLIPSKLSFCRL